MAKKQTFTGEESDEELVAAYREQEDASYARNKLLRNIGSVVIVAGLLVYLLGPGEPFDVWKSVLLVVLFAGIMAVTYWQQKVREYVVNHREWEKLGEKELAAQAKAGVHKNAPNRNQKNKGKNKKKR
jgi:hypothetical protein